MGKVQVFERKEPGFGTVVICEGWKVAVFNSDTIWKEEKIAYLQKHEKSDEDFILLKGVCTLLLSDEEIPTKVYGVKMEQGKVYNVPKGVWHSHVLKDGTSVIVVENSDTTPENSPKIPIPYPIDLKGIEYRSV